MPRPCLPRVSRVLAAVLLLAAPVAGSDYQVVINEIHYHPADPEATKLEFLELRNLGPVDVDLGGWQFTEGIDMVFAPGTVIPAGGYLVVSPDPDRAMDVYGLAAAAGPYSGQLDNGGEVVALVNASGRSISRVHYEDGGVWPALADGLGPSLEFTGSDTGNDLASRWAPSRVLGGTPGAPSSRSGAPGAESLVPGIVNEVRPSGGPPSPGFIELFNPTGGTLVLGGFVIRFGGGESFRLAPGTSIPVGGFLVLGDAALGFPVPSREDVCLILEPDARTIVDTIAVAGTPAGQSTGRYPDGNEDVFVLAAPTSGAANVHSLDSPVVINEIHFHPGHVPPAGACLIRCSDAEQWIEVWNRSGAEVDLTGWSLTKAVDFTFPPGTRVPAGTGLVVAANVAAFQAKNPGVANVVGGWLRRLSHASDTINLRDALGNRVDHVKYGDGGPLNDEEPLDGIDDGTFRSSLWPLGADGTGHTLELLNPALENDAGLAWRASAAPGGTPGAQSSVYDATPPPVAGDVRHRPVVPRSADQVVVTCSITSLQGIGASILEWSRDGTPLQQATLRDNGAAPDAAVGDGVWSAAIPAQPDGTVVRFRIIVVDGVGNTTSLPLAPTEPPYPGFQGPYFLYEVDDSTPPANGLPTYRIILREADLEELQDRDLFSDVLLPGTFIAGNEVRYVAGIRYRGETSRREDNRSYRVELPAEEAFDGVDDINLNGSNGGMFDVSNAREILATDLFRRAGAPYPQAFAINMHFPGEVEEDFDTRYARKENFDTEFLHRFFGGSDGGNLYRALNPEGVGTPSGDLQYLGPDPEPYRPLYEKRSNEEEDDYSDLIALTRALDPVETPDEVFPDELDLLIDARQWAQFFALQGLLANVDGGIWNNNGEDYFLYRVPSTSTRPDAGRFLLLPWDIEETFTSANERLFRSQLPTVRRFLTHPRFAKLYYDEVDLLRSGPFARSEMRLRLGFVAAMYAVEDVFNVVDPIETYVTARNGFIDRTIPRGIVAGPAPPAAGTPVISPGDLWRFFRGMGPPSGNPFAWTSRTFNDASWETGPTGIGYGDSDDATVLDDMEDEYTTVFTRGTFQVEDPARVSGMTLALLYDDAFVAYVNGVEVARSDNAPGSPGEPVLFDDTATSTHEADEEELFEISPNGLGLVAGTNVLAVAVLNEQAGSSDLSFIPTLSVSTAAQGALAGGCGGPILAMGSPVALSGTADPAGALSVTVNGILAESSYITAGTGPYGLSWRASVDLDLGENRVTVRSHDGEEGLGAVVATEEVIVHVLPGGGFTQVGGTLPGNTTWTAAGGPYRMVDDVEVPAGSTLTMGPGTVVLGDDGAAIVVQGRLVVDGSAAAPVLLGAFSCGRPWGGIVIEDTGTDAGDPTHVLRNAVVQFATSSQGAAGILDVSESKVLVEGSTFRDLAENAIDAVDSRVEVRDSLFEQIFEGVHGTTSTVIILDSTFRGMIGDNDAIDFDGDRGERSQIARCRIEDSADDGIDLAFTSVDIQDNVFRDVADKAISLEGNGALGPPTLTGNLIIGCGTGMAFKDGVTIETGGHNTITECQEGISLFARDAGPEGGHGVFHSVIVWNNVTNVMLDEKSSVSFEFSDVGGGAWPGTGNISMPPRFMAPSSGNFSLAPGSPCIRTGRDGTDMGAIPFAGEPGFLFLRGDLDSSGNVDISDPIAILNHLFSGGTVPDCQDILDANDDGMVNITDPIYVLQFLFQGGSPIKPPYPEPGADPTEDSLSC